MTIKALYPTVRPTLNLDFAKTKALDPRITFTRASTATFVGADGLIKTAASGVARFDHNPTTGESLGLLVEEARTNLQTFSQGSSLTAGGTGAGSITYSAGVAPDGTTTATSIKGVYTYSAAWPVAGGNYGGPFLAEFNASTGVITKSAPGLGGYNPALHSTFLTVLGNGWYRIGQGYNNAFQASVFVKANGANVIKMESFVDTLKIYVDGTSTTGFLVWGAQLEANAFPTSYIPTVASTVTRAAELTSITGTNFSSWYNQSQGTVYQSVKLLAPSPQDNQYYGAYFAALSDATTRITHDYAGGGGGTTATIILSDAGTTSATLVISPFTATTRKTASALQVGSVAFAANDQIVTGTATAMPSTVDRMFFSKSGFFPNTIISRFAYYPVRLPDAQLQALNL